MTVVASDAYDVAGQSEKMPARLYQPVRSADDRAWECRVEIGAPLNISRLAYGETSLQALILGLKFLSILLYSSDLYRRGELGIDGTFGGNLFVPATKEFLDTAPYPF
jgi:hypothetical protein